MNIIEKILANASGKQEVSPGEIVEANIDVAMTHDLTGPLAIKSFREIDIDIKNRDRYPQAIIEKLTTTYQMRYDTEIVKRAFGDI